MAATDGNDTGSVALELERLRGECMAGFATLTGKLDGIDAKLDRTAKDVEDLDERVKALEARRVPWPLLSAMATAGGGLGALAAVLAR